MPRLAARCWRIVAALALTISGAAGFAAPAAAKESLSGAPEPPLGRAVVPPRPLLCRPPDPARLAAARALLLPPAVELEIGGYLLLTEIADPALLARATAVVASLETVYFERYGRRPVGKPCEAIVLFSSAEGYRRYQAGEPRLAGLTRSTGLAGSGVVATFRGARSDDELLGTLVHELGHLLNRRAIGPALPSWLDEGIADDLGASRVDRFGRLVPGSWSRNLEARDREIQVSGGEAALRDLADVFGPDGSAPGRLDLGAMLALEWEDFVAEQGAELHYAAAAAFIRMLLAAPAKSTVFRGWLAKVSEGGSPAAEELRRALDRPWEELEHELALWTRGELARLPPLRPAGGQVSLPPSPPGNPRQPSDNFRQVPVPEDVAWRNFATGAWGRTLAPAGRRPDSGPARHERRPLARKVQRSWAA